MASKKPKITTEKFMIKPPGRGDEAAPDTAPEADAQLPDLDELKQRYELASGDVFVDAGDRRTRYKPQEEEVTKIVQENDDGTVEEKIKGPGYTQG